LELIQNFVSASFSVALNLKNGALYNAEPWPGQMAECNEFYKVILSVVPLVKFDIIVEIRLSLAFSSVSCWSMIERRKGSCG
jgi:hypothetical protein